MSKVSNELTAAHDAAMRRGPALAVTALLNSFGSTNGTLEDVPADRHERLMKSLTQLANSSPREAAQLQAAFSGERPKSKSEGEQWDAMAANAMRNFGNESEPQPAPSWDKLQATAMKKFNNPPPVERDDK